MDPLHGEGLDSHNNSYENELNWSRFCEESDEISKDEEEALMSAIPETIMKGWSSAESGGDLAQDDSTDGDNAIDWGDGPVQNGKAAGKRYYADIVDYCGVCKTTDHSFNNCDKRDVLCLICSTTHKESNCPLMTVCFRCWKRGHQISCCQMPNPQGYSQCKHCLSGSHSTMSCPSVWRKFVFIVKGGKTDFNLRNAKLIMACYSCGGGDHFGDDCINSRTFQRYPRKSSFNRSIVNFRNESVASFFSHLDSYSRDAWRTRGRSRHSEGRYRHAEYSESDSRKKTSSRDRGTSRGFREDPSAVGGSGFSRR